MQDWFLKSYETNVELELITVRSLYKCHMISLVYVDIIVTNKALSNRTLYVTPNDSV